MFMSKRSMHMNVCTFVHVCLHVFMHVRLYECTYMSMCARVKALCMFAHTCIKCKHVGMYVCLHVCVWMYIRSYQCRFCVLYSFRPIGKRKKSVDRLQNDISEKSH